MKRTGSLGDRLKLRALRSEVVVWGMCERLGSTSPGRRRVRRSRPVSLRIVMGRTEHYANRDASDTFVGPAVRV
jgi:hypothetical protein